MKDITLAPETEAEEICEVAMNRAREEAERRGRTITALTVIVELERESESENANGLAADIDGESAEDVARKAITLLVSHAAILAKSLGGQIDFQVKPRERP